MHVLFVYLDSWGENVVVRVKGWGFRVLCWGLRGVGFGGLGLRVQG